MSDTEQSFRCVYCNQQKPVTTKSLEHIWPQGLGGALCPELFKTHDVCRGCNSTIGTWVDGAALKNWLVVNDNALAALEFFDSSSDTATYPFTYQGSLADAPVAETEVCELWLGLRGEHVYHVHEKDDPRWATFAGGDFISRKKNDPGRAYLFFTHTHEKWFKATLRSFRAWLPLARRFAGNFELNGDLGSYDDVVEPLDADAARESILLGGHPTTKRLEVHVDPAFDFRFLGKLARGLGYSILGPGVLDTEYGGHLLQALWARDAEQRAAIRMRGIGFFDDVADPTAEMIAWPAGYTIKLHAAGPYFGLSVYLPSGKGLHVSLSDSPELWKEPRFDDYRSGQVHIVMPHVGRYVGPLPLGSYLAHRMGTAKLAHLLELESLRKRA